jgi:hypothetical protein
MIDFFLLDVQPITPIAKRSCGSHYLVSPLCDSLHAAGDLPALAV